MQFKLSIYAQNPATSNKPQTTAHFEIFFFGFILFSPRLSIQPEN